MYVCVCGVTEDVNNCARVCMYMCVKREETWVERDYIKSDEKKYHKITIIVCVCLRVCARARVLRWKTCLFLEEGIKEKQ